MARKSWGILLAVTLPIVVLTLMFQLWQVDLMLPLLFYKGDYLFGSFIVKSIIDNGWFYANQYVGLPHFGEVFLLHDFPLNADFFDLAVFKILSFFTSNPFLIISSFFILTFPLITLAAFLVLRQFNISEFSAILISTLYAFLPYHFLRGTYHLCLSNYAVVPLMIMVGLWFMNNRLKLLSIDMNKRICLRPNTLFFVGLAITVVGMMNGVYYAYYYLVIMCFSWFISSFKRQKFFDQSCIILLIYCLVAVLVMLLLYKPVFEYWETHQSLRLARHPTESELFALRIIDLFIPVSNHYLPVLSDLSQYYLKVITASWCSGLSERMSEGLGILGSLGFVFMLIWMLSKQEDENKSSWWQRILNKFYFTKNDRIIIPQLCSLNLMSLMFATVGGGAMMASLIFSALRSHARFSIFIAFLIFFVIAIIFDRIIERKMLRNSMMSKIFVLLLCVLALFDQVGVVSSQTIQSDEIKSRFISDKNFINKIEATLPQNSRIFMLPVQVFPEDPYGYEDVMPYLHSHHLSWSYPVMRSSKSSAWQKKVEQLNFDKFISALKEQKFGAVYLNKRIYSKINGDEKLEKITNNLKKISRQTISSEDKNLILFLLS